MTMEVMLMKEDNKLATIAKDSMLIIHTDNAKYRQNKNKNEKVIILK